MRFKTTSRKVLSFGLLCLSLVGLATPGNAQGLRDGKSTSTLAAYHLKVTGFDQEAFTQLHVSPMERKDKGPWNRAVVDAIQMCPAGYINAKNDEIRGYQNQRITSMKFSLVNSEGKKINIPYNENPSPDQTCYWNLTTEKSYGYDQVHLRYPSGPGNKDLLYAEYKGVSIKPVFGDSTKLEEKELIGMQGLTAEQRRKYLSLDSHYFKTTKDEMDNALRSQFILRGDNEPANAYALRLINWANAHFGVDLTRASETNVIKVIQNQPAGNCNMITSFYGFALRSQGIPARMQSGRMLNGSGHAVCDFWDDENNLWQRMTACAGTKKFGTLSVALKSSDKMIINEIDSAPLEYQNQDTTVVASSRVGHFFIFDGPTWAGRSQVLNDRPDLAASRVWKINPGDPNWVDMPVTRK